LALFFLRKQEKFPSLFLAKESEVEENLGLRLLT